MQSFAALYAALDETTKTSEKIAALTDYFRAAAPADAAWAIYFLSGRKLKQIVPTRRLAEWAAEEAQIPPWLFQESYDAVGDLAETIALVLPISQQTSAMGLSEWVETRLLPLRSLAEAEQRAKTREYWSELGPRERFVWNKLITGAFRVGVSQRLVVRALADLSGHEPATLEHRLMGNWEPTPQFYAALISAETTASDASRPYPFYLASPLAGEPEQLGDVAAWQAEWKWDGIRAQLVRRGGETYLWSRGEELITDRFPEISSRAETLPAGTAIDGEVLAWQGTEVQPFTRLQRRIGRKAVSKKILADVPVIFMMYDLLEERGQDIRGLPLYERRQRLEALAAGLLHGERFQVSPRVPADDWPALAAIRAESRARGVEGLMLKRLDAPYRVGRVQGDWWKWKIDPLTIDAVLIYAQRGSGRRASLYTDYTFAVWKDGELVPFAKAYSGLTDAEIREVDAFVRRHTHESFGPVRSVTPQLVFELAFESIQRSTRHKSGVAVRFPRIVRWRRDKKIEEADRLEAILERLGDN